MNIVASAVKKLGKLPFDQLLKGVGAVTALMTLMVGFIAISDKLMTLEKSSKGISKVCKAMIALSVAILILSASVKILGNMPLQDLVEGVSAIGVLLLAIGGFVALLGKFDTTSIGKVGLGLVIFAAGISILTKNVKDLGSMKIENLAAGLGSLIVMLIAIFGFFSTKILSNLAAFNFGIKSTTIPCDKAECIPIAEPYIEKNGI